MDRKTFAITVMIELVIGALGLVMAWFILGEFLLPEFVKTNVIFHIPLGLLYGASAAILVVIIARNSRVFQKSRISKVLIFIKTFSWPQAIILSVAAGVCEELLFRGALQPLIGIWFSSALFAVVHAYGKLYLFISFLASLGLGYIYIITGSLVAPIIAHAIYDFLIILAIKRGILPVAGFVSFRKTDSDSDDLEPSEQ